MRSAECIVEKFSHRSAALCWNVMLIIIIKDEKKIFIFLGFSLDFRRILLLNLIESILNRNCNFVKRKSFRDGIAHYIIFALNLHTKYKQSATAKSYQHHFFDENSLLEL